MLQHEICRQLLQVHNATRKSSATWSITISLIKMTKFKIEKFQIFMGSW